MRLCASSCGFLPIARSRLSPRFARPCDPGATSGVRGGGRDSLGAIDIEGQSVPRPSRIAISTGESVSAGASSSMGSAQKSGGCAMNLGALPR